MNSPNLELPPFTIHNLPYGVITTPEDSGPRCAIAIGEHALDLAKYARAGKLANLESGHNFEFQTIFAEPALNSFAALPSPTRRAVREQIQTDLKDGQIPESCFVSLRNVKNILPMRIGVLCWNDFHVNTEELGSNLPLVQHVLQHLTRIYWFRWYAPSVYNGRNSSVVPSGTDIRRPKNVYFSGGLDSEPTYGPTRRMDYELEMGYFVSQPVPYEERMDIKDARDHIFGFVLLNDWSARDHQAFEMRPLGPFHSKGFGTSISNWIVPIEALEPFSCAPNTKQDPPPFEHLTWPTPNDGALDIKLKIKLVRNGNETVLSTSNLKYLYWTPYQQLTHHANSGCGMRTGDLIGTGTISGSGTTKTGAKAELGCLYEAVQTKTDVLPPGSGGYEPGYLEDGDEIILEGWCEGRSGQVMLGFSECRGRIVPPK